MDSKQIRVEST